ncbi:hypothetical protein PJI17_25135 [Mycobacterium kansasii]
MSYTCRLVASGEAACRIDLDLEHPGRRGPVSAAPELTVGLSTRYRSS